MNKKIILALTIAAALSGCSSDSNNNNGGGIGPDNAINLYVYKESACGEKIPLIENPVYVYDDGIDGSFTEVYTNLNGVVSIARDSASITIPSLIESANRINTHTFADLTTGDYSFRAFTMTLADSNCTCRSIAVEPVLATGHMASDIVDVSLLWSKDIDSYGYSTPADTINVNICGGYDNPITLAYKTSQGDYIYGTTAANTLGANDTSIEVVVDSVASQASFPAFAGDVFKANAVHANGATGLWFNFGVDDMQYPIWDNLSADENRYMADYSVQLTLGAADPVFTDGVADGAAIAGFDRGTAGNYPSASELPSASFVELAHTDELNFSVSTDANYGDFVQVGSFYYGGPATLVSYQYIPRANQISEPNLPAQFDDLRIGFLQTRIYRHVDMKGTNNTTQAITRFRFDSASSGDYGFSLGLEYDMFDVRLFRTGVRPAAASKTIAPNGYVTIHPAQSQALESL